MATRNLTSAFVQKRDNHDNHDNHDYRRTSSDIDGSDIENQLGRDANSRLIPLHPLSDVNTNQEFNNIIPEWKTIADSVNNDFETIKKNMTKLSNFHKQNLLPSFNDTSDYTQSIEIITGEITRLFVNVKQKIQKVGIHSNSNAQDIVMRKNLQSSLATQARELSVRFRDIQKSYLHKLKQRDAKFTGDEYFFNKNDDDNIVDDDSNYGFTTQQQFVVDIIEQDVNKREQEILDIAKNINELAEIFNDLSVLIIDQGEILDRIDYNIETAGTNVEKGNDELKSAAKSQAYGRSCYCIMILAVIVIIMIVVVILKTTI